VTFMQLLDGVYTYGISEKKLDKTLKKMKNGKIIPGLWLVTLPLFKDGILEIYDYNQLLQPFYKTMDDSIFIIGISKDRAGANEIVTEIVQGMYDANVDFDVRKYLGM